MAAVPAAISEADQNELMEEYKQNGHRGLKSMILRNSDKWKQVPIRIAVTGNSGVGKSSFINAFLRLRVGDEGAAEVGVTETTDEIKDYPHPEYSNFILYDLPGVGTPKFPKESYLRDVSFERFDFFIIISSQRFTENDVWLGDEVKRQRKKLFFVRSKIDNDIESELHDRGPINGSAQNTLQKVRHCLAKQLSDRVFLITTRNSHVYDFPELSKALIKSAPALKREALILALPSITKDVIKEKALLLQKRADKTAVASGIFGAIPIPGISVGIDAAVILGEAQFYRKQFQLDEKSLKEIQREYPIDLSSLQLGCKAIKFTEDGILMTGALNVCGTVGKIALPIIGSILAGFIYYDDTREMLRKIILVMEQDALKVNEAIAKCTV